MAVKTINDTAGPNGLIFILLVFDAYPKFTSQLQAIPIAARAAAVRKAMAEVRKLKARRDVATVLKTRNGPDIANTLELPIPSEVKM
jgi:hypothetical protein